MNRILKIITFLIGMIVGAITMLYLAEGDSMFAQAPPYSAPVYSFIGTYFPISCNNGDLMYNTLTGLTYRCTVSGTPGTWTLFGSGAGTTFTVQANGTPVATNVNTTNYQSSSYVTQTVICTGGVCSYQPSVDTTKIPTNAAIQAGQLLALNTTSSSTTTFTAVMASNDPLAVYTTNQQFIWNVGSTGCAGGAMTLNIDSLGAIALKQADGTTNLLSSQCAANMQVPITYDGVVGVFRGPEASSGSGTVSKITVPLPMIQAATSSSVGYSGTYISSIVATIIGITTNDLPYIVWITSTSGYAVIYSAVPAQWTSGAVNFTIQFEGSGSGNTVQYSIQTGCYNSTGNTYNTAQNFTSTITSGGTIYTVVSPNLTMTGCTAGAPIQYKIARVDTNGTSYFIANPVVTFVIP